jgi:hypothetical protein
MSPCERKVDMATQVVRVICLDCALHLYLLTSYHMYPGSKMVVGCLSQSHQKTLLVLL